MFSLTHGYIQKSHLAVQQESTIIPILQITYGRTESEKADLYGHNRDTQRNQKKQISSIESKNFRCPSTIHWLAYDWLKLPVTEDGVDSVGVVVGGTGVGTASVNGKEIQ